MNRLFLCAPLLSSPFLLSAPPPYQEKIRGIYENKIRQNAAPEKIFDTFASVKENKHYFMSPLDLFRAITPYNYAASVESSFFKDRESFIMSIADANKDGRISFAEYFFFIVLMSTPYSKFEKMISKRGGEVNLQQFLDIMLEAKKKSPQGKRIVSSNKLDPRSTTITDEDFRDSCENLFKESFKGQTMTWPRLKLLKDRIAEELLTYEFSTFEAEESKISLEDFGKALIASMPTSLAEMYLARLAAAAPSGRVGLKEYLGFMFMLQDAPSLQHELMKEFSAHGQLRKPRILKIFQKLLADSKFCCENGFAVSEAQVDLFIYILDLDDSGSLEPKEILCLMGGRGTLQAERPNFGEVVQDFKKFSNSLLKFLGIRPIFKDSN
jgi:hypothetical protein